MDIRVLDPDDIPAAKALWKEAFSDSDTFIDWCFGNKILPGASLGLFDSGLVSVLHMMPYTIRVQGRPLESAFIAGAATAKWRQGQGHMRRLLLAALELMKQRGILMTHLYPFKHSFYEKFGWAAYSYVNRINTSHVQAYTSANVVTTTDYRVLEALYLNMMRRFDGYVIRCKREWRWRLEELWADGGKAIFVKKNKVPAAYMLYYVHDDKANIVETVYSDDADIQALIAYIFAHGAKTAQFTVPANSTAEKFGMARVVDTQALLKAFGAESLLERFSIVDDFASWNNAKGGAQTISIKDLAQIVHGVSAYNQNNKYTEPGGQQIFIHQNTCIFETY